MTKHKILLDVAAVLAFIIAAVSTVNQAAAGGAPEDADLAKWRSPSVPRAVAERRIHPDGDGLVFLDTPLNSSSYAHRQGDLAVQLPAGAQNLRLKLLRHEGFVFGTAFSPETVADSDLYWYLNTTQSLFNGLTPENRFKWPLYEYQPGQYQQAAKVLEQQYVAFAQAADFDLVRGHTLEWGKVGPFWAHELDCEGYVAALKARVARDVKLFKGKFNQYDVFNEIIESPGMLDKCNLWDTAFPDAFKLAHAADPTADLCINDLSLIEAHNSPELMRIVKEHVWAHDAPIHCIGIQAHFTNNGVNLTHQQEKLDLLATLGLDLYITEFSLFSTWKGPNGEPISYLDEATQARTTVELFRLWFSHPAVKGIIMWGWWDNNIWAQNAGIYRPDKTPKQAALAIRDLWDKEFSTAVEMKQPKTGPEAWNHFRGYYGTYKYEYTSADGQLVQGTVLLGRDSPVMELIADTSFLTDQHSPSGPVE